MNESTPVTDPNSPSQAQESNKPSASPVKWLLRFALPLLIIALALFVRSQILGGEEPPQREPPPRPKPVVEVMAAERVDYTVVVSSQGTVEAGTTGSLQPEVAGKITSVSPSFRDGGFFVAGETLVAIDDREFKAQLSIAKAEVANASLALNQERTRSKQVRNDFKRLGSSSPPTSLALRKPQLEAASAGLQAAEARLDIARLAVDRSQIVAPYNGRIVNKRVDVGQYVTPATVLADIYATDAVEVRLPLADSKLQYLQLPERATDARPEVTLTSTVAGVPRRWQARLVRTEGSIDETTRQRVAIAQIIDPFAEAGRSAVPIKIGQFVEAEIAGDTLNNVLVLPSTALVGQSTQNTAIFVLDEQQALQKVDVQRLWQTGETMVVRADLTAGTPIVVTAPPFGTPGMQVLLPGQKSTKPKAAEAGKDRANKRPQPADSQ